MKHLILAAIFILMIFSMKSQENKTTAKTALKDTTIIGKAMNAKAGAVVVTLNEKTFYVDGVERWDAKTEGKLLKVKGKLSEKEFPGDQEQPDPKKELSQHMEGTMTVIKNAKWKVVKK